MAKRETTEYTFEQLLARAEREQPAVNPVAIPKELQHLSPLDRQRVRELDQIIADDQAAQQRIDDLKKAAVAKSAAANGKASANGKTSAATPASASLSPQEALDVAKRRLQVAFIQAAAQDDLSFLTVGDGEEEIVSPKDRTDKKPSKGPKASQLLKPLASEWKQDLEGQEKALIKLVDMAFSQAGSVASPDFNRFCRDMCGTQSKTQMQRANAVIRALAAGWTTVSAQPDGPEALQKLADILGKETPVGQFFVSGTFRMERRPVGENSSVDPHAVIEKGKQTFIETGVSKAETVAKSAAVKPKKSVTSAKNRDAKEPHQR